MTVPTSIPTALQMVREVIQTTLDPLTGGNVFENAVPVDTPLPAIAYQSQDGGGIPIARVGMVAWSGLITVRSYAISQDAAEQLALATATTLPGRYLVDGARVVITLDRPIVVPPTGTVTTFMAAFSFECQVQGA